METVIMEKEVSDLEDKELIQNALESYKKACNSFDDDTNQKACAYIGELYNRLRKHK